eukprot:gene779-844_t
MIKRRVIDTPVNYLYKVKPETIRQAVELNAEQYYEISSVSPTLIKNDDIVTVILNTSTPSSTDWVGAYSPPDVNISESAPVKFGYCKDGSGDYLNSGVAQLTFNMTNLRAGIKFYYFTNDVTSPVKVATSNTIVHFADINEPLRNRILPTGDPNVYQLLWSSANSSQPIVKWGTQSKVYSYVVNASTVHVNQSEMCGAPANSTGWRDLGSIHQVNISGILDLDLSSKSIFYVFGDGSVDGTMSKEVEFLVPPRAGRQPPSRPTVVALLADLGVGSTDSSYDSQVWEEACAPAANTSMSLGERVRLQEVDAVFLSGDISYADGYMASWDFFLDEVSPILGGSLFLSTVGNHESDWPGTASLNLGDASAGECGVPTMKLLPEPSPATRNVPWWSYDIGLIHFIGMSTEHNYTIGSPQYEWLELDLAHTNRSVTPWVIFSGHRPMYVDSDYCCPAYGQTDCAQCAAGSDVGGMQAMQENIEPLLFKYRVNLAFSGHFHNMQRQSAVYQDEVIQAAQLIYNSAGEAVYYHDDPDATVWMVVGSAGNGPDYASKNYSWSEKYWNNLFGYAIVTAVNSTYLSWELINSATDEVVDRMAISQDFEPWVLPTTDDDSSNGDSLNVALVVVTVVFSVLGAGLIILAILHFVIWPRLAKRAEDGRSLTKNVQMPALDEKPSAV